MNTNPHVAPLFAVHWGEEEGGGARGPGNFIGVM
jgi:hypothetical protein